MSLSPQPYGLPADEAGVLRGQIEDLRAALDAIRDGGVDAVVMRTPQGERVYTLNSADRPYRVIVEEMGEAAATISERGIVLYTNRRLTRLLARDRVVLLGRDVADLVHPAFHKVLSYLLRVAPGVTRRAELELSCDGGACVPVHVSVTGLDVDGIVVRCLVATDLTGPRRAEQEIAQAHAALARKAHELEEAQRVAGVGSWLWDLTRDAVDQSAQTASILEAEPPGTEPLTFSQALVARIHPDDQGLVAARDEALRTGGVFTHASRVLLSDGSERHIMLRGEAIVAATGEMIGMRGTVQDVTALTQAQQALLRSSAQFVAAFEEAPLGMALVDAGWSIIHANQSLSDITRVPRQDLYGRSLTSFMACREGESEAPDRPPALTAGVPLPTATEAALIETCLTRDDGDVRQIAIRVAPVGGPVEGEYAVVHIEDITERKRYETRLRHLADHDPLTGLLNRRGFREALEARLAGLDAQRGGTAMVLLDLDNFKYINDTLGHSAGDELLQAIARAIGEVVGGDGTLARIGGDEFAVLLTDVDADAAGATTREILTRIAGAALLRQGVTASSTASAGIVMLGRADAETIVANADLAMYAAKRAGGDRLYLFGAGGCVTADSRTNLMWLDRIRKGLGPGQFELMAQPILSLASDRISGGELLLRLREGDQVIGPEAFLGIAQDHGLSLAIDRLVVVEAIRVAAELTAPPDFRWEINLSGAGLCDSSLLTLIESELQSRQLPAQSLVFEITETSAISNLEQAKTFAAAIRRLGCGFAIDDFGRGYGSFYYLKHLPLDYLKIDGEFIRELTADATNRIIVESIVDAARRFGLRTVAEYVPDQDTLDLLHSYHVDYAQGFHIGAPTDPDALPGVERR